SCCKVGCNGTARTSLLRQAELLHPASVKAVATKHQRRKGFISHSRRQQLDERPVPRRLNKASCLIISPPPERRANGNLTRLVPLPELPARRQAVTARSLL